METQNTNRNPKVLLVEDEKIIQMVHSSLLRKLGCEVELAENGEQALKKFGNGFDVILMDIGLPDMRGSQVAAEIRRSESGKRTPIVAVTAYTGDDIDGECTAAGMDAIYNKPVTDDTMKKILVQFAHFASEQD